MYHTTKISFHGDTCDFSFYTWESYTLRERGRKKGKKQQVRKSEKEHAARLTDDVYSGSDVELTCERKSVL